LCQVGRFFHVLWFYSTKKTDRHNINEILMKVALSTITKYKMYVIISVEIIFTWYIPSTGHSTHFQVGGDNP
jgi:hypothetical protein